jgi:hypothetical protein
VPLLILALDTLPGAVVPDSSGTKMRLALGFGDAGYEEKFFDCDGNLESTAPVDVQSMGGRLDIAARKLRVTACLGRIESDVRKGDAPEYNGAYRGLLLAGEWRHVGLGAGFVGIESQDGFLAPSIYLRGGSLDGRHFRLELLPPSEMLGSAAWLRAGVGWNQGWARGTRGFVGVGMWPYTYAEQPEPRLVGEFDLPVSRRIDLLLRGQIGAGVDRAQGAAGVGVAIRLDDAR